MATAGVVANRRALAGAVKTEQQRIRARALSDIRGELASALERRRHVLATVRAQCARARVRLAVRVKERRAAARAVVNAEVEAMRVKARGKCAARRALVGASAKTAKGKARAELREAKRERVLLARLERRASALMDRRSARERAGESDDEVRGNLEPEMVPIFDRVRRKIGAKPGASRTEAFLHWVHENAGEVWALREKQAAAELRALLAEERRHHAALRACGGKCHAVKLEEAPF